MMHSITSTSLIVIFTLTNAVLISLYPDGVPRRDIVALVFGFVGILGAMVMFPKDCPAKKTASYDKTFQRLSALEVICTILVPWCIILVENSMTANDNNNKSSDKSKLGFMISSHLFTFQAQICLEGIISFGGERRSWLMFPYTCVANAYRAVAIVTGWMQVFEDPDSERGPVELALKYFLPLSATVLWIYSSFVFIPFYWYPALSKKSKQPVPQKKRV